MIQLMFHDSVFKGEEHTAAPPQNPVNMSTSVALSMATGTKENGDVGASHTSRASDDAQLRPLGTNASAPPPPQVRPTSPDPGWSYEECVLFDSLLARFGPDQDIETVCDDKYDLLDFETDGSSMVTRWERIAAMLPDKTSTQCRARFTAKYSDRGK
mmetsp:Transcript_40266/g.121287  ORF Transcript_40266/g.121287 Transcript_40266/m.121287 type:complete len:157 (-) Transcript_40266:36-506(-)